eukprot:Awhi_evm1s9980
MQLYHYLPASATTPVKVLSDWIEEGEVPQFTAYATEERALKATPPETHYGLLRAKPGDKPALTVTNDRAGMRGGAITLNVEEIVKFELDKGLWHTTCAKAYKATLMNPNMLHEVLGPASTEDPIQKKFTLKRTGKPYSVIVSDTAGPIRPPTIKGHVY